MLIILVVFGHFELIGRVCYNLSDPVISEIDKTQMLWVSFFMPAFFFITGLCTNFDKPFRTFFISGVKMLLIPAIIINIGSTIIEYASWNVDTLWIFKTITKSFILTCAGEWFIPSMFIARLLVWLFSKIKNIYFEVAISLILMIAGVILYNNMTWIPDIWYFKHALLINIFMLLGKLMKGRVINMGNRKWLNWIYIPIILCFLVFNINIPYITNKVNLDIYQIPEAIILGISATFFILYISRIINLNKLLQYFGRNSLVIYLTHFIFYRIYIYIYISTKFQSINDGISIPIHYHFYT